MLAPVAGRVHHRAADQGHRRAERRHDRHDRRAAVHAAPAGAGAARGVAEGRRSGPHRCRPAWRRARRPTGTITLIYPQIEEGRVVADAKVADLGNYFVGDRVRVWISAGTRAGLRGAGELRAHALRPGLRAAAPARRQRRGDAGAARRAAPDAGTCRTASKSCPACTPATCWCSHDGRIVSRP